MSTQGERLKEIRKNLNLTQGGMGETLNMSKQYFSKAETGKILLNNKQLVTLCIDYNVNINYLLTGEGEMFINSSSGNSSIKNEIKQAFKELAESGELFSVTPPSAAVK